MTIFPPIDKIKSYFGEKIAMYFSFLSFYSIWLLTPGLLGIIVFGIEL